MEVENNNLCGNTHTAEYSNTEPCEQVSTNCVIYEGSLPELSLNDNPGLTSIINSIISSLINLSSGGTVTYKIFTFSTLPTGEEGMVAYIDDANNVTYRGIASGGGTEKALVFYNGTDWIYH